MENIKVALRIRPIQNKEIINKEENIWSVINKEMIILNRKYHKEFLQNKKITPSCKIQYQFDYGFDDQSTNLDVFNNFVQNICQTSIQGINGTIFMYGQTGSGKTYTTLGKIAKSYQGDDNNYQQESLNNLKNQKNQNLGVLILALDYLFNQIQQESEKTYNFKCSYYEIYNECVFDLLRQKNSFEEPLIINEDVTKKDFYIKGLKIENIQKIDDVLEIIKRGEENRHYAETILNHSSSRSHTIFQLYIQGYQQLSIRKQSLKQQQIINEQLSSTLNDIPSNKINIKDSNILIESQLNFVDLAGSEKISNHHTFIEEQLLKNGSDNGNEEQISNALKLAKERIKESQSINKSLFFLTQVISLQSQDKPATFIPYRNSSLTKILKSSIGGNSRTLIVLCITPIISQFDQSLSTMRFGQNAKKIVNKYQINEKLLDKDNYLNDNIITHTQILQYEKKIEEITKIANAYKTENDQLRKILQEVAFEKNDILERLKNLMKRSVENEEDDQIDGMLIKPVQYQENIGILFHTKQTFKNSKIYATLDRNICNLLYDYEGKLALMIASKLKKQINLLNNKVIQMEQNFLNIQEQYIKIYEQNLNNKQIIIEQKTLITQNEKKQLLYNEQINQYQKRLDQFENLSHLPELSDEDINKLETQLFQLLDKLKQEKAKRIYREEIIQLKQKLGIHENVSNINTMKVQKNQSDNSLVTDTNNQIDECQELQVNIYKNQINPIQEEIQPLSEAQKKLELEKCVKNLQQLFHLNLEQLNQNLQNICLNANEQIFIKENFQNELNQPIFSNIETKIDIQQDQQQLQKSANTQIQQQIQKKQKSSIQSIQQPLIKKNQKQDNQSQNISENQIKENNNNNKKQDITIIQCINNNKLLKRESNSVIKKRERTSSNSSAGHQIILNNQNGEKRNKFIINTPDLKKSRLTYSVDSYKTPLPFNQRQSRIESSYTNANDGSSSQVLNSGKKNQIPQINNPFQISKHEIDQSSEQNQNKSSLKDLTKNLQNIDQKLSQKKIQSKNNIDYTVVQQTLNYDQNNIQNQQQEIKQNDLIQNLPIEQSQFQQNQDNQQKRSSNSLSSLINPLKVKMKELKSQQSELSQIETKQVQDTLNIDDDDENYFNLNIEESQSILEIQPQQISQDHLEYINRIKK